MICEATKRCTKCGDEKPIGAFHFTKGSPDGLAYQCRTCCSLLKKQRNAETRRRNQSAAGQENSKRCPSCSLTLPATDFYKNLSAARGRSSYCKHCSRDLGRANRYGLKLDQVRLILHTPRCQACGHAFKTEKEMHFDHCHETGEFRGVLCKLCNTTAAGPAARCIELLSLVKAYLERSLERPSLCQN